MYTGMGIHVALNKVNPAFYDGWNGFLTGAVNDGTAMAKIASQCKYDQITSLINENATRGAVKEAIEKAQKVLYPGDLLMVSYSGHGTYLPDKDGDEPDKKDEAWCLYDGLLIDDELFALWKGFRPRTRIIVISDSCHSGTVIRGPAEPSMTKKAMPDPLRTPVYEARKDEYDRIQRLDKAKYELECTVGLISGCQDNQYSFDGAKNGLFTEKLLEVWADGAFSGDYWNFHRKIIKRMPDEQSPNLMWIGFPNIYFTWAKPFAIR